MISQETEQTNFDRYIRPNKRWVLYTLLPFGLIVLVLFFINWGLRTQIGADESFDTFELPYVQPFDDVAINRWFMSGGAWSLDNGSLIQSDEGAEVTKIFVPHWLVKGEPYHLTVDVTLSASTQAVGVNFNAQYPDIHHNHQRVYLTRNGSKTELVAGRADEDNGFEAQVTTAVPSTDDTLRLDLFVHETSYDVHINGQPLIENRPLMYYDGLVGLFAIGGPTMFDNLQLDGIDDTFSVDLAVTEEESVTGAYPDVGNLLYTSNFNSSAGDAGWVSFGGDWRVENGYLSQLDPNGYDFGIGYEGRTFDSFVFQVSLEHLTGSGGGILFNMLSPYQAHSSHMVRYSDQSDAIYWGYFDETRAFNGQGHAKVNAPEGERHTFKIISGEFTYAIYLDNQLIASDIPLYRNNGYIGLIVSQSTVAYNLVDTSTLLGNPVAEDFNDSADVVIAERNVVEETAVSPTIATGDSVNTPVITEITTTATDIPDWIPFAGQWEVENGNLKQLETDGYDLGIGYDSDALQSYTVEVSLKHLEGVGSGLLFNMPTPYQQEGAHIVRYADWTNALIWGYFDESGAYYAQGHIAASAPSGEIHTLKVESGQTSYAIYLDDQLVVSDVPLVRNSGHIGLTSSHSTAVFGPIEINDGNNVATHFSSSGTGTATSATPTTTNSDFFGDIRSISGDWVTEGDTIYQNNPATYDFSISAGVYAGSYTLETAITLPDDPELQDAGGGILFHMPDRGKRDGAHMVRLTGQDSIIWGYYDAVDGFVGQGRGDLVQGDNITHTLKIIVRDDTYDIEVDGEIVTLNVQLKQDEGWIGLVSYRGPVMFNNVNIAFGVDEQ